MNRNRLTITALSQRIAQMLNLLKNHTFVRFKCVIREGLTNDSSFLAVLLLVNHRQCVGCSMYHGGIFLGFLEVFSVAIDIYVFPIR